MEIFSLHPVTEIDVETGRPYTALYAQLTDMRTVIELKTGEIYSLDDFEIDDDDDGEDDSEPVAPRGPDLEDDADGAGVE